MSKPVIFISYSHKDRSWLDYVRSFLATLAPHGTLLIWDDEKLRIGDDWRGDIYSALDACDIFVLLVSRYALTSKFIVEQEVGRILRRPKGSVKFCPIVVTPYYARSVEWLDHPNRRPPDNKALSELLDPARDREMAIITEHVDELLQTIRATPPLPQAREVAPVGDSAKMAFPSIVDYGRLPEMPFKKLVGRDEELRRLDDAWADEKTRILSLVAWGGAGKTSLVVEWLARVRSDGYRNANAVLCWSFFSQGTKERAASGEGFLDWALGKLKVGVNTTSSTIKGERLADEMSRRRVLLVLDGLEPVQYGPEGRRGALKDQGLRAFLRSLAAKQPAAGHSLVVLTSRLAVYDLRKWQESTAPLIDLGRLSDEAGAALLEDGGVKGTAEALREAVHDFAGHALALSLLAAYLKLLHRGDVHQRRYVRVAANHSRDSGHDQARRVIEAYDNEWLVREPILREIMLMVGLFDRPAGADCLMSLRAKPVIDGLTNTIVDVDAEAWRASIGRLREARLLDPEDPSSPDALDAHPLIREWFGERLNQNSERAWTTAHGRLYEHLCETREGDEPTLEDLGPLYQAIAHGCCAGRYREALENIYISRICRRDKLGNLEFYARDKLGAFGSDLAAVLGFFDKTTGMPHASLGPKSGWVLADAAMCLRAQGRFAEALPALRAAARMSEDENDWRNAGISLSNLSEAELLVGEILVAINTATRSVEYADRSGNEFWRMSSRVSLAESKCAAGSWAEAEKLFVDAERRQAKRQKEIPQLYSVQGFQYCNFCLEKRLYAEAKERAAKSILFAINQNWLLDIALDTLTLGRAQLGLVLEAKPSADLHDSTQDISALLADAVNGLRSAGVMEYIPCGLLAQAVLYAYMGDWERAQRNFDEIEESAESGPMKLYLCDTALNRARLALARIELFIPLYGPITDSRPKPLLPDGAEVERLKHEATQQLAIAVDYIKTCGYHRRDQELAELRAVLRGEETLAGLLPRV